MPGLTTAEGPYVGPCVEMPEEPLIVIQSSGRWAALNLQELWTYRELLYFLTLRDVQVRYKQAVLGAGWAIIQPLVAMIIFTLFFGRLAGLDQKTGGVPYPLFAYAGLLPWTFFANAVANSGSSLVSSANLITKVYFPRMIIPAAAVGAALMDFAIACVVLAGLMMWFRVGVTASILLFPVLVVLTTVLALGVGMWTSAINVKYRDVRYALPFLIQIWMFISPVIYPVSMVQQPWRSILALNPLTGLIEGYRSVLFGTPFDVTTSAISVGVILVIVMHAAYAFRRMEKTFADVV